jgi:ribosomal protein L11 methyltransferase
LSWILLKIQSTETQADLISDALMEMEEVLSASIEDAHADTQAEQAIFGEPGDPPPGIWQDNIVTAMINADTNIANLLQHLQSATSINHFSYTTEKIEDRDWVRATQSQFEPIKINDSLWIVPTWHNAPESEAINIILDPGLAFGTGSHPTTHLCLDWLCAQSQLDNVLDYGCGSGILSIAAKKLGAKQVVGLDIDPQAVISSRFNAKNNTADVTFYDSNTQITETFDVVVANILSSALTVLAPILANTCKKGGKIALSGILDRQQDDLINRYSEWFDMDMPTFKDGWVLLTGTRK